MQKGEAEDKNLRAEVEFWSNLRKFIAFLFGVRIVFLNRRTLTLIAVVLLLVVVVIEGPIGVVQILLLLI